MICHYKFALSKYKVALDFFLIYSENSPKTSVDIFEYYNIENRMLKANNSTISNSVNSMLKYLSKIWKYLQNTYFINSNADTSAICYKIIKESKDNELNMIITKDYTHIQNLNDNTIIIRPFKEIKDKKDSSFIINNSNMMKHLLDNYKVNLKYNEEESLFKVNRNIISLFFVLSGLKQRTYNKLFKINETLEILNNYCRIYSTDKVVPIDLFKSFSDEKLAEDLLNRWRAIDSEYQYNIINDIFIDYDVKRLIDKEFLLKLNEAYFNNEVKIDEISN